MKNKRHTQGRPKLKLELVRVLTTDELTEAHGAVDELSNPSTIGGSSPSVQFALNGSAYLLGARTEPSCPE